MTSCRPAVARGHLIVLLIEAGADVDARDAKGRTSLFLACQGGYDLNAEYLILLGARTSIRNRKGKTPLDVAAKGCLYLKGDTAHQGDIAHAIR